MNPWWCFLLNECLLWGWPFLPSLGTTLLNNLHKVQSSEHDWEPYNPVTTWAFYMKSEFGLWTSHFFLCFFLSSSKQEYSKSLAKGMLVLPQAQPVQISKVTFPGSNTPLGTQRPLSSSSFYNIYLAAPGFSWDAGFSCPHPGGILVPWPKGSNWSPLHCKADT